MTTKNRRKAKLREQKKERGDFKIKFTARPIKDGYIGMNKPAYERLFKKKYPYSDKTILVYKGQSKKMQKDTFEHEKIEYALMNKGYSYRYAHQISIKYEKKPKSFDIEKFKGKGRKKTKVKTPLAPKARAAAQGKLKTKTTQQKVTVVHGKGMRTRQQVAINFRYKGLEDGESIPLSFVSIRAVTVNPDITETGLKMAVREARERFKRAGFNPSNYNTSVGYEKANISSSEDKKLNDGRVYIEILENRRSTVYPID